MQTLISRPCRVALSFAVAVSAWMALWPAARADVMFALENVDFNDGASATGGFTIDESTGDVTAMNIQFNGGTSGVSSYHYTDSDLSYRNFTYDPDPHVLYSCEYPENSACRGSFGYPTPYFLYFGIGPYYGLLELGLDAPLGQTPVDIMSAYAANGGSGFDTLTVESGSVDPVPEPASLALFGAALFGLGAVRRRKRTTIALVN